MPTLHAETREAGKTNAKHLRKAGRVPAVYYGRKEEATPITITQSEFLRVWHEAGESTVIDLATPERTISALIHDIELHPVTGYPVHIDFYTIEKGKSVQVTVPLEFEGEAPAVKELGGILVKVLHDIDVEAMPDKLPHAISVDITQLTDMDSVIHVKDIAMPEGVTPVTDPEEVVASMSEAQEEAEEPAEEVDMDSIEVEQKGKQEEEGEEENE